MLTESSDETARRLAANIAGLANGLNMYDVQRALVAVMSTGICVAAQDEADIAKFLGDVSTMLRHQVSRDFPKIKRMQSQGEVNSLILPSEKM